MLVSALATACAKGGVTFTVRNAGDSVMAGVVVQVTGKAYPVGDLLPGESKSMTLAPTGESHVEIAQIGNPKLVVDCYFEPGYEGTIEARLTETKVVAVKSQLRLSH